MCVCVCVCVCPPHRYGAAAVSDSGTKSFSFTVTYQNPDSLNGRFWYAWRTCLIVFEVVISFPLALWKLYQYMRKRRGDQADQVCTHTHTHTNTYIHVLTQRV